MQLPSRPTDGPADRRGRRPRPDGDSGRRSARNDADRPATPGLAPLTRRDMTPLSRRDMTPPSRRDMTPQARPDVDGASLPPRPGVNQPPRPGRPANGRPGPTPPNDAADAAQAANRNGRPPAAAGPPTGGSISGALDGAPGNGRPNAGANGAAPGSGPGPAGRPNLGGRKGRARRGAPQPAQAPGGQNGAANGGPVTEILDPAALEALRGADSKAPNGRRPRPTPPPPPAGVEQLSPRSPLRGQPRPGQPLPPTAHEVTQEIPAIRAPIPQAGTAVVDPPETCDVRPHRADDEDEKVADNDKVKAIDATLARFTAVHDELALEEAEAARTGVFSWVRKMFGGRESSGGGRSARSDSADDDDPERSGPARSAGNGPRNPRSISNTSKALGALALVLVLVGVGYAWTSAHGSGSEIRDVAALDLNSPAIQAKDKQQGDENFLIVGSDGRAGATPDDNAGDAQAVPGARSDTVMVAHIPADRSRATIVSFPRDLEIQRPSCAKWDPSTGKYGAPTPGQDHAKLNTAFAVGGPKCVTDVVQQMSGLAINHFIGVDFQGFKSMVDAVHGVDVCFAQPMHDDQLGTVVPGAGHVTLSGDQALNYVRARHVTGDKTSDYGRIKRQQRFLASFLRTAAAPQTMADPAKLRSLVQALSAAAFGDNISADSMFTLAQSVRSLDPSKLSLVTVPTSGTANAAGNETLKQDDANALFHAIIGNTALPGDPTSVGSGNGAQAKPTQPSPPSMTINPDQIKVQVLNTTGKAHLGTQIGDKLTGVGYQVVLLQDSTDQVDSTVIRYAPQRADYANTLASSIPGAVTQLDPSLGGAIQLYLGPGFKGEVDAPSKSDGSTGAASASGEMPRTNAADTTCDSA